MFRFTYPIGSRRKALRVKSYPGPQEESAVNPALEIAIFNNLTRKKELLQPLEDRHVRMYACGTTPYDDNHIGHAMQAIFFDVIRNFLEYAGYKVTYVRNFTDVDDKIIARAALLEISPKTLVEGMIAKNTTEMKQLSI